MAGNLAYHSDSGKLCIKGGKLVITTEPVIPTTQFLGEFGGGQTWLWDGSSWETIDLPNTNFYRKTADSLIGSGPDGAEESLILNEAPDYSNADRLDPSVITTSSLDLVTWNGFIVAAAFNLSGIPGLPGTLHGVARYDEFGQQWVTMGTSLSAFNFGSTGPRFLANSNGTLYVSSSAENVSVPTVGFRRWNGSEWDVVPPLIDPSIPQPDPITSVIGINNIVGMSGGAVYCERIAFRTQSGAGLVVNGWVYNGLFFTTLTNHLGEAPPSPLSGTPRVRGSQLYFPNGLYWSGSSWSDLGENTPAFIHDSFGGDHDVTAGGEILATGSLGGQEGVYQTQGGSWVLQAPQPQAGQGRVRYPTGPVDVGTR